MRNLLINIIVCIIFLFIESCGRWFWIEQDCREFYFHGEEFWFPETKDAKVVFMNTSGQEKTFTVIKKKSSHVSKYITDTGCGCKDYSNMILIDNNDTIYLMRLSTYVYDNDAETFEDIVFMFNRDHSIFFETEFSGFESFKIDSITYDSVRVYKQDYDEGRRINEIYFVKGIGILRFIMQSGEVWTNRNISIRDINNLDSFDYEEKVCE